MNGVSVCLEEIALEGLDGITIPTLWRRISSATMWSTIDGTYKEFLWRCVTSNTDIQTYLLEKPRGEILDFGNDAKIYPYRCISEAGVRGSCSTFKTRKLIDVSNLTVQTTVETYGNRLILVASQLLRNKALLGPEFDVSVKITDNSYCVLEIIGRARNLGCLNSHLGLQTLTDSRTLFSHIKTLLKLELITKQSVYIMSKGIMHMTITSIIYLTRYHTEHANDSMQNKISEALSNAPDNSLSLETLCENLQERYEIVERVVEDLSKSGHLRYMKDGNISTDGSEDLFQTQESERNKVVQFVRHFYNLCIEDDETEDEEWTQSDYQELSMGIPAELPILHAIYNYIESKGKDGASLTQCCEELSMPFFKMRKLLKDLETLQVLFCKFVDHGNTKRNQYFARHLVTQDQGNSHASQITQPPAIQITQAQTCHISQPHAIQSNQDPPSTQRYVPASQVSQTLATEIPSPPVVGNMQPLADDETTTQSAVQSSKPEASQITTAHTSHNDMVPTTQAEPIVPHDLETTIEENISLDGTPPLFANTCNANDTTEPTRKGVRSRNEKLVDSEKFIRRKEIVLNLLKNLKVVNDKTLFGRVIRTEENKMGLTITADHKSVLFLVHNLKTDGLLKTFEVEVKVDDEKHKVELFCDNNVQQDDVEFISCIQRMKDEMVYQKAKQSGSLIHNVNPSSRDLPKMQRCELLHTFMFYVIYELSNPHADLEAWKRKYDWAEHLKPEHVPSNIGKGWFTPYSILLLLPVSLYFKLVSAPFHNSIVQQYYDNPATRHMLLKDLPPLAREILVMKRKNLFLFASFEFLASFGLITPTNKLVFVLAKDIACFLHTSTALKDTRESQPSYVEAKPPDGKEFPERIFSFSGLADVEQYWSIVKSVCRITKLNRRQPYDSKKSPFKSDLPSLAVDEKELPTCSKPRGDGLGAAGFDSRMFCHLAKHWDWSVSLKNKLEMDSDVEDSLDWQTCFTNNDVLSESITAASGKKMIKRKRQNPAQDGTAKKKRKLVNDGDKKTDVNQNDAACSSAQHNSASNLVKNVDKVKKKRKKRKQKKKKKKAEHKAKPHKPAGHWATSVHDQRDEDALKQMHAKRNTFTPQQQKLLFICCVALRILGKKSTDTGYSDWLWTRDILYRDNYESAKTKTALSISRKYRSMMGNAQTKTNLEICVADCVQENEFQPYCNIKKSCTEVMFNELVELLKKKYSMESMISSALNLPSTMQEFEQLKNLYSTLEVEIPDRCDDEILSLEPREASVADVRQRIIRDSIVSALLLENDDYESHVAFRFLSQFTEEELIIAISLLKNRRIVVRKSLRYTVGLDLATCAFSQMLSSVARRTIENHFHSSLMNDAKLFYDEIKCGTTSEKSVSLENDETPKQFVTLKFSDSSILGAQVYCIFSLLSCQKLAVNMEVPEKFLVLEKNQISEIPDVPENLNEDKSEEVNSGTIEREESSSLNTANTSIQHHPSETCKISEDGTSEESCREKGSVVCIDEETNSNGNEDAAQRPPITMSGVKTRKNVANVATTKDQGDNNRHDQVTAVQSTSETTVVRNQDVIPEESRVMIQGYVNRKRSNDMVLDVLCGIEDHLFGSVGLERYMSLHKVNLQPTSTFTCTMTTSDVDSVRASSNDHVVCAPNPQNNNMYEGYLQKIATYRSTGDVNRILFSINPCIVQIRLLSVREKISTPKPESLAQSVANHLKSGGLRMPTTIDECVDVCSKVFGYTNKDCQALKAVYEIINNSKEIGMSSSNVNHAVKCRHSLTDFSTGGLIKVLEAFTLVYQVGFVEVCYVTKEFKEHWFVTFRDDDVICSSSSEMKKLGKQRTTSGKRKRSSLQDETIQDTCARSGVTEGSKLPENSQASDVEISPSDKTTSPSTSSRTVDEQNPKKHETENPVNRARSSEDENSMKQISETQTVLTASCSTKPSRPWITMSGEINKSAYNTLHRSVVAYIIKYPGVQKYAIAKHFLNLVFPVAIDDILQKLEECGCIEQHVCYTRKTTLFSSKAGSKASYYLPRPDALLKLMERVYLL